MRIDYRVIPHTEQRYETPGDYWLNEDTWHFRVSQMSDDRYHWLVFLHELIEWALLLIVGIQIADVDAYDVAYEDARATETRAPCGCAIQDEPGYDRHAPYHLQHRIADTCERIIALFLGVDWTVYGLEVEELST